MRSDERAQRVGEVIGEMGRERLALRAKRTATLLLGTSSSLCMLSALLSLTGYLPYALGPSIVLMVASVAGFATIILESRHLDARRILGERTSTNRRL